MDHIKPLIAANGDISYWQLPNLQTLCTPCHTAKTSQEATERAAKRKLLKEKDKNA
jgi:5-methylcytosine-specific restriction endonuclease McrA